MSGFDNDILFVNRDSAGISANYYYNAANTDVYSWANSDGSPEGVVAADIGSICTDTTNGSLYVKTTDTVATGWELVGAGGDVATLYDCDVGSAVPVANTLQVAGGTGLTTTGVGAILTIDLDTPVTVPNGGTGATSLTDGGIILGSGTGAVTVTAQPTNGQLLIGSTGVDPVLATLTAGTGISITEGAGSITIDSSGGGFDWVDVTGTSDDLEANTGYIANNAALVTLTLPATATVGDTIIVTGLGAGGWTIAQNAGQLIHFGSSDTTTGAGGSLSSTDPSDTLTLVCVVTNTTFNVISSIGNITVV